MKRPLTDKEKIEIVEKYLSGASLKQLGEQYDRYPANIYALLKKRNIKTRSNRYRKKYTLNENFFEKIDSEEKAQTLGYLFADGYNGIDRKTIMVNLAEEDKDYLEKICKVLNYNKPLEYVVTPKTEGFNRQNQYRLRIYCTKMCEDLFELGCVQKKSLTIKFPDETILPKHLIRSFILGYFDGDGGIGIYESKRQLHLHVSISGTFEFLSKIKEIFKNEIGINSYLVKDRSIYSLRVGGNQQYFKLMDWLYKNPSFIMNRKYAAWIKSKQMYEDRKNRKLLNRCNDVKSALILKP